MNIGDVLYDGFNVNDLFFCKSLVLQFIQPSTTDRFGNEVFVPVTANDDYTINQMHIFSEQRNGAFKVMVSIGDNNSFSTYLVPPRGPLLSQLIASIVALNRKYRLDCIELRFRVFEYHLHSSLLYMLLELKRNGVCVQVGVRLGLPTPFVSIGPDTLIDTELEIGGLLSFAQSEFEVTDDLASYLRYADAVNLYGYSYDVPLFSSESVANDIATIRRLGVPANRINLAISFTQIEVSASVPSTIKTSFDPLLLYALENRLTEPECLVKVERRFSVDGQGELAKSSGLGGVVADSVSDDGTETRCDRFSLLHYLFLTLATV